jgi:hypothetical protein
VWRDKILAKVTCLAQLEVGSAVGLYLELSYGSNSNIKVRSMSPWIGADGTAPPDNIPIAISQT